MKVDAALVVGEALFPVLSGFHEIGQQPLRAVWQASTGGCLDQIIFDFDRLSLIVSATQEDDSIDFDVAVAACVDRTGGVDASQLPEWKDLIDVLFGWGWVTVNQQGYCDGLLLSFGGIVPQVVLNVTASSILVGRIGTMWTA